MSVHEYDGTYRHGGTARITGRPSGNRIFAAARGVDAARVQIIGARSPLGDERGSTMEGWEGQVIAGAFLSPEDVVALFDGIIPGLKVEYVKPVKPVAVPQAGGRSWVS